MQYNSHLNLIQIRSLFTLMCDHSINKKIYKSMLLSFSGIHFSKIFEYLNV